MLPSNPRIAFVGEAMIEAAVSGNSAKLGVAGDTLNAAVYMHRALNTEMEISFVSVVGTDPMSDRIVQFVRDQGLSTQHISRDPHRMPGLYTIETDEVGERNFSFWRDTSAARQLFQNGFEFLEDFDVIYLSAITLAILPAKVRDGLLDWLRRWDGTAVFDSNFRPVLWENMKAARHYIERAWRITDIALPSLDDEMAIFGDADEAAVLSRLKTYCVSFGVLKRGDRGPTLLSGKCLPSNEFAKAASVVDTTAAGDSFGGTFLAKHFEGCSESEAAIRAHNVARQVVGFRGAFDN